MPSLPYNIEEIERFLLRRLPPAERQAFEQRLASEPALKEEADQYRKLYESFTAASCTGLRQRMKGWEASWLESDTDNAELMDWYLDGAFDDKARPVVESHLRKEAQFESELEGYRQLKANFRSARAADFREKIQGWEKAHQQKTPLKVAGRRPLLQRLAVAASLLLLLGLGLNWYARANYQGTGLATTYYQAPRSETTLGEEKSALPAITQSFQEANRRFQSGDFPAAYQAFDELLGRLPEADLDTFNRTYFREQSEWNRLLAAIAMPDSPIDVKAEARRIAGLPGHEYQDDAAGLARQLESVWYRWANG